jgi:hypothetical protein
LKAHPEFVTCDLLAIKSAFFPQLSCKRSVSERTTGMKLFAVTNRKHVQLSLPGSMFWQIVFLVAVVEALLCVLPIELAGAISSIRFFFFGS